MKNNSPDVISENNTSYWKSNWWNSWPLFINKSFPIAFGEVLFFFLINHNCHKKEANSNKLPRYSNKLPVYVNKLPGNSNKLPRNSNKLPSNSNKLPGNVNKLPAYSNKLPGNSNKLPGNENKLPFNSQRWEFPVIKPDFQGEKGRFFGNGVLGNDYFFYKFAHIFIEWLFPQELIVA